MNQVLSATIIVVSIIVSGAYAASLITEMSAASTISSEIDNHKKSESIRAIYDGTDITVVNMGKARSEIAFFRFYDSTGSETSRIMVNDKTNRNFGADIPTMSLEKIPTVHGVLDRHSPQTFSLSQLRVASMDDLSGEIITKYGNVFAIQKPETLSGEDHNDGGTSILDGLGVSLFIENIDTNGKVYFGNGIKGLQTDIREYVGLGVNDDWVTIIADDDPIKTLFVPEFAKEYRYESGTLIEIADTTLNILGYTASKTLSGALDIAISDAGLFFSGDGEVILKLHDYSDQPLFLRGDGISDGSVFKIITSSHDLINEPYVEHLGYLSYSADINPKMDSFSVVAGIDSAHTGVLFYDAHAYGKPHNNGHSLVCINVHTNLGYTTGVTKISNFLCDYTLTGVKTTTDLIKTDNRDHITITGDSTWPAIMLYPYFHTQYNDNFIFNLYDTLPSIQRFGFAGGGPFEKLIIFPSEQTYLYVKLDGGQSYIKGEAFNPASDVFFKVHGLAPDTAYDISKSTITRTVGKTDSNGVISLLYDDVSFEASASSGGILKIYPESVKYTDELGAGMIDLLHKATARLPLGDDLLYIPQNYVRWVFPVGVEVENVSVDDMPLDYLNRYYTKNEALLIPVIPSAHTIHATINEEDVKVLMRDVFTTTRLKHVPQKTATTSAYASDEASYTSSNISTSTFLTATHLGIMNVNFNFKVAASADFTIDSSYTGEFTPHESCTWHGVSSPYRSKSCRIYSSPANPEDISNMHSLAAEHQIQLIRALENGQASHLTVEVDIFQNMQYVRTILLHTLTISQAHVTSTFSEAGYDMVNKVRIVYPLSTVSDQIAVPVTVGDMMEFVIRVNLDASGAPIPASNDAAYASYVRVSTEFGGGIITAGMS